MIHRSVLLLVSMAMINGCTINHYHGTAYKPSMVDDSLLVIPEPTAKQSGALSALSKSPSGKSQTLATGLKSPGTVSPDEVLSMVATGSGDDGSVQYMDSVGLQVQSHVDAYLNCYHEQADGAIIKVFPNRYARRYWVYASQQLTFPNEKFFKFLADTAGSSEGFICLISQEDILSKLPKVYQAPIFQKLPVNSFDSVYALYDEATEENLAARVVSYTIGQ